MDLPIPFSANKNTHRNSILKSGSKNRISSCNKDKTGLSTAIAQSVTFKDPPEIQQSVRQFKQEDAQPAIFRAQSKGCLPYSNLMLVQDINFINNLYNSILIMVTSQDKRLEPDKQSNEQLKRMSVAIEQLLVENIKLKQNVDRKYKNMKQLHQLAEYLHVTPQQLLQGDNLADFFNYYEQKQQQLKELEAKCKPLSPSRSRPKGMSQRQRKQRQKRIKQLKTQCSKQQKKIEQLTKEERQILQAIDKAEKQISKNGKITASLTLKINEIESRKQYQLSKKRQKEKTVKIKERAIDNPMQRHLKIQRMQRIKSKSIFTQFSK